MGNSYHNRRIEYKLRKIVIWLPKLVLKDRAVTDVGQVKETRPKEDRVSK